MSDMCGESRKADPHALNGLFRIFFLGNTGMLEIKVLSWSCTSGVDVVGYWVLW